MSTALKKSLRSFILSSSAVTDLIGSRLYPTRAPEKPDKPYCVFKIISNDEDLTHDGGRGLQTPLFQLDIYDDSSTNVEAVGDAIKAKVSGFIGQLAQGVSTSIRLTNEYDNHEKQTRLFHKSLSLQLTTNPS